MMPGMPDLSSLLQQAQQMQADMARAQSDLAQVEVTGHSGGGLVTATVTGDGQLKALVIDPSVVDPAEVETLADLIIAAVRDASRSAAELAEQSMGSVAGGLGGPGGGFDLSAFGLPSLDGLLDDSDDDDDGEFDDELGDDEEDEDEDDLVLEGAALIGTPVIDAVVVDAVVIDGVVVDGVVVDAVVIDSPVLDTDDLNDMVDAEVIDAEVIETEVIDAEVIGSGDPPATGGPDAGVRSPQPPSGA